MEDYQIVGVIPAAGRAKRLGQLPFSKELFPIGFEKREAQSPPKAVSKYLLENMAEAGVSDFHFIIRNGKWDIPAFYLSGKKYSYNICYHVTEYEYGVPFTINQAYQFYRNKIVLLGFPDVLVKPKNAFTELIKELIEKQDCPLVLGLFPTSRPEKYDMVNFNEDKRITEIKIKSQNTEDLKYAWVIAAWKPEFSEFINDFVKKKLATRSNTELTNTEYHIGDVITSAIKKGMKVLSVVYNEGKFIDIGTHEDLGTGISFFD